MAHAYTTTGSLSLDQASWDTYVRFALRPQLFFDSWATVQADNITQQGSSVGFTFMSDLAAATTALSETVDLDAVAMADSQITLTPAEYGNAVITTAKARATSFVDLDPIAANLIAYNAGLSIDTIARNTAQAGTNVRYASTAVSRVTVGAAMTLTAANVRRTLADMRNAFVAPVSGTYYAALIHPDVSYDLRGETGAAAWRDPHTYSQPGEIWSGEVGAFEGFRFSESPRAPLFADAGVGGTVDVYATLFVGQEAIGKAYSTADGNGPDPSVVPGPVTDTLRRLVPIGWYHFVGYGRTREAALRRFETSSSIGTN